jgi:hypothetical protein
MAIQVTGLFKNPTSNLIHESPSMKLVSIFSFRGKLDLDVHIKDFGVDTIVYKSIDRGLLQYDSNIIDPYDKMISALENYVIDNLKTANSINSAATFTKI